MEVFLHTSAWFILLTLTFLEVILGIDNIIFISIVTNKLPEKSQAAARNIGLVIALILRIILLFGIYLIMGLDRSFYTTEKFVELARAKHGDTYDYSSTVYVKSNLKLTIICRIHGEFSQSGSNHIQGHGCDKCAHLKTKQRHLIDRKTNEQFIAELNDYNQKNE